MSHLELKEAALEAVRKLHGDTSVSLQQTFDSLLEVLEELEIIKNSVAEDLSREEEP